MKKIIVALLFIVISNVNAAYKPKDNCTSPIAMDSNYYVVMTCVSQLLAGWLNNWTCFNNNIRDANKDIENFWKNDIKPIIDDIKEESDKRKANLKIIKALERERLLIHKEIEFYLKQETELLSNQTDLETLRKVSEE